MFRNFFIVTESWEDLTNENGSGLYFNLVRIIYELVGIRVENLDEEVGKDERIIISFSIVI